MVARPPNTLKALLLASALLVAGCSGDGGPPTAAAPAASTAPHLDAALEQLPGLVEDMIERTGVPGIAVAVTHNGQTVFAEGFGVRDIGGDEPVDADTVFQIASLSKSVGATVVATLVADGTVNWDDPVTEHLPDFALTDPYVTANGTIGDFYAHRTGLPHEAGDLLESIGFDRDEILARLRQHTLDPFRTSYAYANFGTTTGAEAAAAAAGTDWETLSEERLYTPLGMESTSSRHSFYLDADNKAIQHAKIGDTFEALYVRDPDAQSPAGGVNSTVRDLARWMGLVLGEGTYGETELFTPDSLLPAVTEQSVSRRATAMGERSGLYGYGFNVGAHPAGPATVSHSGAFLLGSATAFTLVPELDLGIVVLTNAAPIGAAEALNAEFVDLVVNGEVTRDWFEMVEGVFAGFFVPLGDLADTQAPADPAPPRALDEYAGEYGSDYYGPLTVTVRDGGLRGALGPGGQYQFDLDPWDGDTFAFAPTGENAPPGSLSSAVFDPDAGTVTLDFFNDHGLGEFQR